jgi:glycosyltransferase involved in cell wall biosynthesis
MKILFVVPFLPATDADHAGGKDIFYLMRSLAKHHQVSVVCLVNSVEESTKAEKLKEFCKHVELSVLSSGFTASLRRKANYIRWPRSVGLSYSNELHRRLHILMQKYSFDIIQYENVQTLPYSGNKQVCRVLDCHDISFLPLFQNYLFGKVSWIKKLYLLTEWPRLQVYESKGIRSFNFIIVRSERDAIIVRILNPTAKIAIMAPWPITMPMARDPARPRPRHRPSKPVVMFVGAMWRPVNSDACVFFLNNIWPIIRKGVPAAEFRIVGSSPPSHLSKYGGENNVVVTGYVDDLLQYYAECSILVAPLFVSGGVTTKVVDAMKIGIPVVSTSVVNQGICAVPETDMLIGDEPAIFGKHVISLLTDDSLYRRLSENAEKCIENRFDWDQSIKGIEIFYENLLANGRNI